MAESVEHLAVTGAWGSVRYAVRSDGSLPAQKFLDQCSPSDKAKLLALFHRMAQTGVINNRTKFKQIEGDIFEFKSHQLRVSCYRDGMAWILLHGFVKKQDHWPKGELDKAKLILAEDRNRSNGGHHGKHQSRRFH